MTFEKVPVIRLDGLLNEVFVIGILKISRERGVSAFYLQDSIQK